MAYNGRIHSHDKHNKSYRKDSGHQMAKSSTHFQTTTEQKKLIFLPMIPLPLVAPGLGLAAAGAAMIGLSRPFMGARRGECQSPSLLPRNNVTYERVERNSGIGSSEPKEKKIPLQLVAPGLVCAAAGAAMIGHSKVKSDKENKKNEEKDKENEKKEKDENKDDKWKELPRPPRPPRGPRPRLPKVKSDNVGGSSSDSDSEDKNNDDSAGTGSKTVA